MKKINVWRVVPEHVATLRDAKTGKLSALDIVVFFVLPVLLSAVSIGWGIRFNYNVLNALLTAFSIFAGLLLNLLLLVFSLKYKPDPGGPLAAIRKAILRELHSNIAFALLVSILVVVVTIIAVVCVSRTQGDSSSGTEVMRDAGATLTALLMFLMVNFLFTILMILKRMHILLSESLNESDSANSAAH